MRSCRGQGGFFATLGLARLPEAYIGYPNGQLADQIGGQMAGPAHKGMPEVGRGALLIPKAP